MLPIYGGEWKAAHEGHALVTVVDAMMSRLVRAADGEGGRAGLSGAVQGARPGFAPPGSRPSFGDRDPIPGLVLTPPAPRRRPVQVLCGDLAIRIGRDGTWYYQGSPIRRKELVCLFASCLKRESDGYWIETPAERGRIEVDDVPFVAVELFWSKGPCAEGTGGPCGCGEGQALTFRTNVDEMVTAGPLHPIRVARDIVTCEPTPYIMVRDGLEARIGRAVYYELVALAVPETVHGERVLGVWSGGVFFPLGSAEE
jgi:hypothetical protein